ncbi:MAG: hypothetical protein SP1CHLAM54_10810 [Chlamydiia bacterium]|nr:hypothetical protein [Chlamydiia bacterium]MCH9615986.1 hypothetical protein [Chlamydiia bacterium]MCH9629009.1 hypothetical protein [Chlamydiia bacterium]
MAIPLSQSIAGPEALAALKNDIKNIDPTASDLNERVKALFDQFVNTMNEFKADSKIQTPPINQKNLKAIQKTLPPLMEAVKAMPKKEPEQGILQKITGKASELWYGKQKVPEDYWTAPTAFETVKRGWSEIEEKKASPKKPKKQWKPQARAETTLDPSSWSVERLGKEMQSLDFRIKHAAAGLDVKAQWEQELAILFRERDARFAGK